MRPLLASDPRLAALARIIIAMDYDQSGIATTYDEARALTPARLRHWQRLLSAHVDRTAISVVVDLGCGTGRFYEMLAAELGARVIGLDPSEKMIDQARRKPATSPVVFGRASAHELPLPHGCVDLVFMSQIYHHLPDPAAVKFELISSPDGKSASSMARTAGKKFGTTTSFSRVPVRMQT